MLFCTAILLPWVTIFISFLKLSVVAVFNHEDKMTISVTWYVVNYFWWDIWPCIHCQHLLPVTLQRICWFFFWTFEAFVFIIFFSIGVISTYKTSWKIHTTIHCFCFTVSSIYGMRKKFDPQAPSTRTSILVLTPSRMDNGLLKFSSINSPPFSTRSHTQTHTQTHTHTHTHTQTLTHRHTNYYQLLLLQSS